MNKNNVRKKDYYYITRLVVMKFQMTQFAW